MIIKNLGHLHSLQYRTRMVFMNLLVLDQVRANVNQLSSTMTVFLFKMTKKCLNFCSATKKYCDNTGWGLCNVIAPSDTAPSIENISIDIIKNIWYTSIPPHPHLTFI